MAEYVPEQIAADWFKSKLLTLFPNSRVFVDEPAPHERNPVTPRVEYVDDVGTMTSSSGTDRDNLVTLTPEVRVLIDVGDAGSLRLAREIRVNVSDACRMSHFEEGIPDGLVRVTPTAFSRVGEEEGNYITVIVSFSVSMSNRL